MLLEDYFTSGFEEYVYQPGTLLVGSSIEYEKFTSFQDTKDHVKIIKRVEWKTEVVFPKIVLIKSVRNLFHILLPQAKDLVEMIMDEMELTEGDLISYPYYYIQDPSRPNTEWHHWWFPGFLVHAIEDYPSFVNRWKAIEKHSNTGSETSSLLQT